MIGRIAVVAAALLVALAPLPPAAVERLYAGGAYPSLQRALTAAANAVPFSWFDLAVVALAVAAAVLLGRGVRRAVAAGWRGAWRPLARALGTLAVIAAGAYLWFVLAWGLNYARAPVDVRLGLPARAVRPAEVDALLARAVDAVNREAGPAHAAGFPPAGALPPVLVAALHAVERADGRPSPSVPGVPKVTLLAPFFRAAGVDGMLAPFVLETLLNPDLTPPERPFVLAHEWAHLSGDAPEADASFTGWRAASRADAPARYSAALFLLSEAAAQVDESVRRDEVARLDEQPRRDLAAIAARIAAGRIQAVQQASWQAYDRYLKAQGVKEGVRSYSRVVELIIRSQAG